MVVIHDEHELFHTWSEFNLSGATRDTIDRHMRDQGYDPDVVRWAVQEALDQGYSLEELKALGSYHALLELVREDETGSDALREQAEHSSRTHDND